MKEHIIYIYVIIVKKNKKNKKNKKIDINYIIK